jgi:hypothetical protein
MTEETAPFPAHEMVAMLSWRPELRSNFAAAVYLPDGIIRCGYVPRGFVAMV